MAGFVKLDTDIGDSSLWSARQPIQLTDELRNIMSCNADAVFAACLVKVFFTMLAKQQPPSMAYPDGGFVKCTVLAIAKAAELPREIVEACIAVLESPDKDSKDQTEEGRRIKRVNGGWFIINAPKYRKKQYSTYEDKRAQNRLRQARFRSRQRMMTILPSEAVAPDADAERMPSDFAIRFERWKTELGQLFGKTHLSYMECQMMREIMARPNADAELTAITSWFNAVKASNDKEAQQYLRQSMQSLLENWSSQIDRANAYHKRGAMPPKTINGRAPSLIMQKKSCDEIIQKLTNKLDMLAKDSQQYADVLEELKLYKARSEELTRRIANGES